MQERIIALRKKGKSIREIAKIIGLSKSRVHQVITRKCPLDSSSGVTGQGFEIHDYQVSMKILEMPNGWSPNAILGFRKQDFKVIQHNGWEEHFFVYNNCSVHITPYKVIIFPPHIQSKVSAEDAKAIATQLVLELVPKIERLLEIKLSNKPLIYMTVTRQHIAMLSDKVYDELRIAGFSRTEDEKGNIRLILDQSGGVKHVEAVHPQFAESDMDNLKNFLLDVVEGKVKSKFNRMEEAIITNQKVLKNMFKEEAPNSNGYPHDEEVSPLGTPPTYIR